MDVNVAIAANITAGARCLMAEVKNLSGVNTYYTDTDSVVTNKPLHKDLVGDKLGQFKLEYEIERAVFLAPKVYGIITTEGKEIIKVKGITKEALSNIHISDLEYLLVQNQKSKLSQLKWSKDMFEGKIEVLETTYTLTATSNKREPKFFKHSNDLMILSATVPYNYSDIEVKNITSNDNSKSDCK